MYKLILTAAICVAATLPLQAQTLLSTGFDGTTLGSDPDMSGIAYTTESGLTGPTTLNSVDYSIFSSADATGHFAPDVQVNNGSWSLSFDMTVGGDALSIDSVTWDRRHFNVSGNYNTATGKTYPITVALTGSSTGLLDTVTLDPASWSEAGTTAVTETFSFGGATVGAGETLTLDLTVGDGGPANNGVFVGFDGFAVNGNVVPETSTATLLSLIAMFGLLRRRR